eukprot:Tbor_TRINITY_DN4987_c4_g1::TRINITY_DN4987_c4_g1_i1::g.9807::m.9807
MSAVTNDHVRRWMDTEMKQYGVNGVRHHVQDERKVLLEESHIVYIKELFEVFNSERDFCPAGDLPIILKALGCDDETCRTTKMHGYFTVEELIPVALEALRNGRDVSTDARAREAFINFCDMSHATKDDVKLCKEGSGGLESGCRGLNIKCLDTIFYKCGVRATTAEFEEIMMFADLDGDGVIGEEDWIKVMSYVHDLTL